LDGLGLVVGEVEVIGYHLVIGGVGRGCRMEEGAVMGEDLGEGGGRRTRLLDLYL
jgi:hypothetical protein